MVNKCLQSLIADYETILQMCWEVNYSRDSLKMASIDAAKRRSETSSVIYYTLCSAQKLVNKNDVTRRHEALYVWHEVEHIMFIRKVKPSLRSQESRGEMESWTSILTLIFGITRTAELSALKAISTLPQESPLVLISVTGRVDPRATGWEQKEQVVWEFKENFGN